MASFLLPALVVIASVPQEARQALEAGDYATAVAAYQRYLQDVDPDSYEALSGLALALARSGQYPEALAIYQRVVAQAPEDPDGWLAKGRLLSWMGRFSEAESDLRRARSLAPAYEDIWSALADTLRWGKFYLAATSHLEDWQRQFPESPQPWLAQAQLQLDQRQLTAARTSLLQAQQRGADGTLIAQLQARLNRLPGALPWEAQAFYEVQAFSARYSPWHTLTAGLRYSFEQGNLTLQSLTAQRFERWNQALVADGTLELWPGSYGNLRVQGALTPNILPAWDVSGDLYQSFAGNWEVSAGHRQMLFASGNVYFYSVGIGSYLGDWYLRFVPQLLISPDGPGISGTAWARWIYDTADDYLEVRLGLGRQLLTTAVGPVIEGQTTGSLMLTAQHFLTPHLGGVLSLNYQYNERFPGQFGAMIGTRFRW
jgi:YaiO family outer membrane protein